MLTPINIDIKPADGPEDPKDPRKKCNCSESCPFKRCINGINYCAKRKKPPAIKPKKKPKCGGGRKPRVKPPCEKKIKETTETTETTENPEPKPRKTRKKKDGDAE
jgi:hypothetical protein